MTPVHLIDDRLNQALILNKFRTWNKNGTWQSRYRAEAYLGFLWEIRQMNQMVLVLVIAINFFSGNVFSKNFQSQLPASNTQKSKANFEKIITFVKDRYLDIYDKAGLTLKIDADWADNKPSSNNAYASIKNNIATISLFGTYYRNAKLTNDGFLSVICHEIGHHLGEKRMSSEGEADYYAAQTCMPYLLSFEDNTLWMKKNGVPFEIRKKCDQAWGKMTPRSVVCARATTAFLSDAKAMEGETGNKIVPQKTNLPTTQVEVTKHPDNQCRMETYLAAGLCVKQPNTINSKLEACSYQNFRERQGMRPTCWKNYPRHPGTHFLYRTEEDLVVEKLFQDHEFNEDFASEVTAFIKINIHQTNVLNTLAQKLFDEPGQGATKELQEIFIASQLETKNLYPYLRIIFSKQNALETKALAEFIISRADPLTVLQTIGAAFSSNFNEELSDLVLNLVERNNPDIDETLVNSVFSKSKEVFMKDSMRVLITRGNPRVLRAFANNVFSKPYVVEIKDLLKLAFEKGNTEFQMYLILSLFTNPITVELREFLEMIVATGNVKLHQMIAQHTFSKPFSVELKDLLINIMNNGDQKTLENLIEFSFSQPFAIDFKELIDKVLKTGDEKIIEMLITFAFSNSNAPEMKDSINWIIQSGNIKHVNLIIARVFSNPMALQMKDLIQNMMEKYQNKLIISELATHVFPRPFAVEMKDLIALSIKNGSQWDLAQLAKYTFSKPHVLQMKDLLQKLIAKCSGDTCRMIDTFVLSNKVGQQQAILDQLMDERKLLDAKLGIKL